MKFPISTIKFLARLPSHNDDTVSADDEARWNGNSTGSFNDPFAVSATDSYGSFDLVAKPSSTTSNGSDDSFVTALEDAEDAILTSEESALYLKNVLGVESNNTDGTDFKIPAGDAQAVKTTVTHGRPWIPVTRHKSMHITVKQRPPTVGFEGRADRNWRTEPGLYGARLHKSRFSIKTDKIDVKKGHKKNSIMKIVKDPQKCEKYDKTYFQKQEKSCHYGRYVGYREPGMPHHVVKELDHLDTLEFEEALTYWMNHFNFIGYPLL